jgi:hypothetical protein
MAPILQKNQVSFYRVRKGGDAKARHPGRFGWAKTAATTGRPLVQEMPSYVIDTCHLPRLRGRVMKDPTSSLFKPRTRAERYAAAKMRAEGPKEVSDNPNLHLLGDPRRANLVKYRAC